MLGHGVRLLRFGCTENLEEQESSKRTVLLMSVI